MNPVMLHRTVTISTLAVGLRKDFAADLKIVGLDIVPDS